MAGQMAGLRVRRSFEGYSNPAGLHRRVSNPREPRSPREPQLSASCAVVARPRGVCGRSCSCARWLSGGVDGDRCSAEGGVLLFGRRVGPPGRGGVPWVTAREGAGLVLKFFDGLHFTLEFEDL